MSAVLVAAFCLLTALLVALATPATEGVRLRNALLLGTPITEVDTEWDPGHPPSDFQVESATPPAYLQQAVAESRRNQPSSDLEQAIALAKLLLETPRRGGRIQADIATTYRAIRAEGRGYCADFTRVFQALAHTAGLAVREWALTFDQFGGDGHVVVEIYDRQLQDWVMLDLVHNFWLRDPISKRAVGVLDVIEATSMHRMPFEVVPLHAARPIKLKDAAGVLKYYDRAIGGWYLFWGNDVLSYDDSRWVRLGTKVSRSAERLLGAISGQIPQIRPLQNRESMEAVRRLSRLQKGLWVALAMYGVIAVFAIAKIWRARRVICQPLMALFPRRKVEAKAS